MGRAPPDAGPARFRRQPGKLNFAERSLDPLADAQQHLRDREAEREHRFPQHIDLLAWMSRKVRATRYAVAIRGSRSLSTALVARNARMPIRAVSSVLHRPVEPAGQSVDEDD